MIQLLSDSNFNFISVNDKEFINDFDDEMQKIGYTCSNTIGPGFCWGRYMIIYSKTGVKNKKVTARIYIRENSIALRLFLNDIDKHRKYVEDMSKHMQKPFTDNVGRCTHCKNDKNGYCKFRKSYTINNSFIEKCNGITFEYIMPDLDSIPDYIELLKEFYMPKKRRSSIYDTLPQGDLL